MLVDTHCHLDAHYFPEGADAVIARANTVGVEGFVVIGVGRDLQPMRDAIALAKRRPSDIAATVGIHPHDATVMTDEALSEMKSLGALPEVVAIGETGLDYHYDNAPRDVQRTVFEQQIALARSLRKPLVIHTREAPSDTLEILKSSAASDVGGIIHCFSEDRTFAEVALDLGFYLSFSGVVTFKNARSVAEVAAWMPKDRILVETDSPYLSPVPMRGKPCEPAYVIHTARRIAELRGTSLEAVAETTTRNAEACFRRTFRKAVV